MTWVSLLVWAVVALSALPALMTLGNLCLFRRLPEIKPEEDLPAVSVLIPARDEEASIDRCIHEVLAASEGVKLEVVVLDDHSSDRTSEIVSAWAARDPRVRLERAPALPDGWNGKQHACSVLADRASHAVLMWIDADVRLQPGAIARAALALSWGSATLISGFPYQQTGTLAERLIVPQIQAVLLGYLPIVRMRKSTAPSFGAGCGQWFIADRKAYEAAGGHAAIRASIHDGVALPRAFRRAGYLTDIFDATDTAHCRMYQRASEVWPGFMKNATEGMAGSRAIVPWTVLLLGGWVMPWLLGVAWLLGLLGGYGWAVVTAWIYALATTTALGLRFRQGVAATLLRPVGVTALILIQWQALYRKLVGRPSEWRGRAYAAS